MQDFRSLLLEALVLIACACLLGLSVNYQLVLDVFEGKLAATGQTAEDTFDPGGAPLPVMLAEIEGLVAEGAVLVDARPGDIYELGYIAGARSLPLLELDRLSPEFRKQVSLDRTIITYCSGYSCPDSFDLALALLADGYLDVRVYEGGFPEWRDAGLPVESGAP